MHTCNQICKYAVGQELVPHINMYMYMYTHSRRLVHNAGPSVILWNWPVDHLDKREDNHNEH